MTAAALSASIGRARATEWPVRPVTIIVPYSPGGNTDMMARLAGQYLADKLGQSFVIENRPGGGGSVGAIAVARAQPDGYTLLFGASTQIINIPMLRRWLTIRRRISCRASSAWVRICSASSRHCL